jgi:type I restriction enzyme R subunit
MCEADRKGEELGLSPDEFAFFTALETNDSAVAVLGDETLKGIAQELANSIRNNRTVDWTIRDSVRAKMRVIIKRILRKYKYPPDKQAKATETILEQATTLCENWEESSH